MESIVLAFWTCRYTRKKGRSFVQLFVTLCGTSYKLLVQATSMQLEQVIRATMIDSRAHLLLYLKVTRMASYRYHATFLYAVNRILVQVGSVQYRTGHHSSTTLVQYNSTTVVSSAAVSSINSDKYRVRVRVK